MKKYYLQNLPKKQIEKLCARPSIDFSKTFKIVRGILDDVKKNGDNALKFYSFKFDGVSLNDFLVSEKELRDAVSRVPDNVKKAFKKAYANIVKFHQAAKVPECNSIETTEGISCFTKIVGIEKVGLYIPGGTAPLPSTVLMLAIPAKLAGCREIILCTPPQKNGKISDVILYAAKIVGVKKIFKIGGAQAISAMAYGTESIPKVYKIFGPGNQYVTAAKMLASIDPEGAAMDIPAGPSEVLIIADEKSNAEFVAADLLSQAEHGADSQVVLLCTNENKAEEILKELSAQVENIARKDIAKESLKKSFCLIVDKGSAKENLLKAVDFSNQYAPEHLILNVKNPEDYVDLIVNAGSVFLGKFSCESAGDYASGTNHTLPTSGYAKAYSGVSVDSFIKKITFQTLTKKGVSKIGKTVETMAKVEGLQAHENAMSVRIKSINKAK